MCACVSLGGEGILLRMGKEHIKQLTPFTPNVSYVGGIVLDLNLRGREVGVGESGGAESIYEKMLAP